MRKKFIIVNLSHFSMVTQTLRIEQPGQYRGVTSLQVSQVGRYNDLHGPITVWSSAQSEDDIPAMCEIPKLNIPTQLPLSLEAMDTSRGQGVEMSAVDRVLRWANAVNYSLKEVHIVAGRSILRCLCLTPDRRFCKWAMKLYR